MGDSLKRNTITGLIWKFLENIGTYGVSFVVSLVLARLLMPSDYGTIAIITIFISLANIFAQCGFGTALIQRKDVAEDDFSSVLILSFVISVVIYIILFICAPFIAAFYDMPILSPVLRVLAIRILIAPFNSVQESFVVRDMQFKKLFYRSLGATLPSGVIGIAMAYMGFGVWALVAQQLLNAVFMSIIMRFTISWRPKLVFRTKRLKSLFSFSWKLLISSLMNTLYSNIRSLIIGKLYNSEMLGYYNRGWQIPNFVTSNINGSIQSVMLPTLSKVQDNKQRTKAILRRSITMSSFLIFPLMAGLAACAEPMVKLILTEKWLPCVPFLQINCIVYATTPIHTANLQAINAIGRSDVFLKLETIKKAIGLMVIAATVPLGVYAIALGGVFNSLIFMFVNAHPNKKLLDYGYAEQITDVLPNICYSAVMFVCVYFVSKLHLPNLLTLLVQVFVGVGIYWLLARLTNSENLAYIISTLKTAITKGRSDINEKDDG